MNKKKYNPGRIPTAKGSIRHKSKKDYNRKKEKEKVNEDTKDYSKRNRPPDHISLGNTNFTSF